MNNRNETNVRNADDINWLASTFIAVSSTETSESTDTDRANGAGFRLITALGSDFILAENTSDLQGDDLSIWNASFTVKDNNSATHPYSIQLENFYYKGAVNDPDTEAQDHKTDIFIGVSGYNGTESRVVSMRATDPVHAFSFSDSSVKDGRELLNDTPTAAIYTIKFVSSGSNLNNKYLTVGENGGAFRYEAKGEAISNTDYPAFQWLITAAEPGSSTPVKYTTITFTNRETGKQFSTRLFTESGTNRYSMALTTDVDRDGVADDMWITPFTVNTNSANTYVAQAQDPVKYSANVIIELEPVEDVDQYAGFLNVENDAIRTLAFARDKNDTSNKLFAVVEKDSRTGNLVLNDADEFATDINSATQWQLVRGKAVTTTRTFVYNNTTTESVDNVATGDKVSAYLYGLRYINDGTETGYFLENSLTSRYDAVSVGEYVDDAVLSKINNGALGFIIKQNVDGSVSLIPSNYKDLNSASNITETFHTIHLSLLLQRKP